MSIKPSIIKGGSYTDHRGTIDFINDFDMSEVKRCYIIKHVDTTTQRGWRAHRIEQRWFYVLEGQFSIKIVKIDNWDSPSDLLEIIEYKLSSKESVVLHIPPGYATLFRAVEENAKVIVFADHDINHAPKDDYVYPEDYFKAGQ